MAAAVASSVPAADSEVVIGNLDDLSGVYSDDGGLHRLVVAVMPRAEAFGPITGRCPLAPK